MAARPKIIVLPSQFATEQADALKQQLQAVPRAKSTIHIDASAVERLTTPYAQMLAACLRQSDFPKGSVRIVNATESLRAAWIDFGLQHHLPLEA